jgi:hypothetical protein
MTSLRITPSDRFARHRWTLVVNCPSCGEELQSATDIPAERILAAHFRFGCPASPTK